MANLLKWAAAWLSRGTVLTTELNALGNGAYSAVGTAYDNTANLDQTCYLDIVLPTLTPAAGAYLQLFMVQSLDGATYEDAPTATNPGFGCQTCSQSVSTGAGAKRLTIGPFIAPPGKVKFVLLNKTGVALNAAGNTATLYTADGTVNG
jgi:hypothetical protein